jgi:hypothetical protein
MLLTKNSLKKGPKVNIVIGPDSNGYIGLEGVSINLLAHYSSYARKKLIDEHANTLRIPDGSKPPIMWIYKYMQAGEIDPPGLTLDALDFDQLVLLYTHSALLDYQPLMGRIFGRLRGKYDNSLPGVAEIQVFATYIPSLYEYAVGVLAQEMVNPWACNYTSYTEYAAADPVFDAALGQAIQKLVAQRVKAGVEYYKRAATRQVIWSQRYYDNVAKGRATLSFGKKSKGKTLPSEQKTGTKAQVAVNLPVSADAIKMAVTETDKKAQHTRRGGKFKRTDPFISKDSKLDQLTPAPNSQVNLKTSAECYACGELGHLARNCDADSKQVVTDANQGPIQSNPTRTSKFQEAFNCYNCGNEGHIARNCSAQTTASILTTKSTHPPPVCYDCNGIGHLARNCIVSAVEGGLSQYNAEFKGRDTVGRNRNFRRAQRDRAAGVIEISGNGEEIRTCDREVRKGEKTRLGLVV